FYAFGSKTFNYQFDCALNIFNLIYYMCKGDKIHATCKMTYIESKWRRLPVGVWCNIQNFHVRPAIGA
ncbi:unnamed protein product, partial [Brassica oleracea var. botrytis]